MRLSAFRSFGLLLLAGVMLFSLGGSALAAQQSGDATPAPMQAATPQLPATVTDFNGDEVTVSDISRIVPLSGDIAEIIWTLGFASNVVGVDISAVYPAGEWDGLPSIGFERAFSAEGVLSLNPTLVIGKQQAGPFAALEQIRDAGIPVVIIDEPQTIDAPQAKIRQVAAALGVPEQGEELATQVENEITAAQEFAATATSKPVVMFLYARAGGIQLIGGEGSVADAVIEAAGGVDAGTEAGIKGFMPATAEAIVSSQPDFIILPSSGVQSAGGMDAIMAIPGVADTPAAQNDHILVYDDLWLLGLTPRTGQTIHDLATVIHPELAEATPAASPAAN